jgi:multiple antibiotic resistance protein
MFENLPAMLGHFFFIIPVTYTALFHVVNPIGSGILFLNLTPMADNRTRRALARKIAINSLIIMVVTLLGGVFILKLFGITVPIVQMCGGSLILAMGWRSLNRDDRTNESDQKIFMKPQMDQEVYLDNAFYPYTFPFTVGPGTIAVVLTVSAESITNDPGNDLVQYLGAFIAVMLVAITIYVCYSSSNYFIARISEQIRKVIMKILSFILLCIGGQIIASGLTAFLRGLQNQGLFQ